MKCDTCKFKKTHIGAGPPDDYSMEYCEKDHWVGGPIDVLKQIRQLDIEHKMEHGAFFLPQEIRAKIAAILLGCE